MNTFLIMNVTLGGHVECIEELLGKLLKISDFISNRGFIILLRR